TEGSIHGHDGTCCRGRRSFMFGSDRSSVPRPRRGWRMTTDRRRPLGKFASATPPWWKADRDFAQLTTLIHSLTAGRHPTAVNSLRDLLESVFGRLWGNRVRML